MRRKILIGLICLFLVSSISYAQTIISLKSGRKIEGKLVEKTDSYIRIEYEGIPLTYWIEDIESMEEIDNEIDLKEGYNKARKYGAQGGFEKAKKEFERILQNTSIEEQLHNDALGWLEVLGDVEDNRIDKFAAICLFHGTIYLSQGKYDKAIREYKNAIEVNPNYAESHAYLGVVYRNKKMWDEAISEFMKVLDIDPDYAQIYEILVGVCYRKKQYDLAIQYCDKAQELGYSVSSVLLEALEPYRKRI